VSVTQTAIAAAIRAAFLIVVCLWPGSTIAQCVVTQKPSCDIYQKCFARHCSCGGPDEYFISYGKKYCEKFLKTDFSGAVKVWRDSTLKCLQQKIIPELPRNAESCDCKSMRSFAMATHVACYTQPRASICSLSVPDVRKIESVINLPDLVTIEGQSTVCAIANICDQQTSAVSLAHMEPGEVQRHMFWHNLKTNCIKLP
jgi:hypothetical protein